MESESRLDKSLKNLRIAWIGQLALLLVQFVSRRVFANTLGQMYLGMESVFANILGLFNMADLGIGASISYALYKPLEERNYPVIQGIVRLFARAYHYIGLGIWGIGMIWMPLLSFVAPESKGIPYVHVALLVYILQTCITYVFIYVSVLVSANQENYIYTRNYYFFAVVMSVVQIVVLVTTKSYILFIAVQGFFKLLEGVTLNLYVRRRYPEWFGKNPPALDSELREGIFENVKQSAVNRVGGVLVRCTDNLILSRIMGLAVAGIYGNYMLVVAAVAAILGHLTSSVTASVGNLLLERNEENKQKVFGVSLFIIVSVYAFVSVCLFNMLQPFIGLWFGEEYLTAMEVVFCIILSFYLSGIRAHINVFRNAAGLFFIDTKKTIWEATVNFVLSIGLVKLIGVAGVVLGTIVSAVFVGIFLEAKVTLKVLHIKARWYLTYLLEMTAVMLGIGAASYGICSWSAAEGIPRMLLGFVASSLVFALFWLLFLGRIEEWKETLRMIKGVLK